MFAPGQWEAAKPRGAGEEGPATHGTCKVLTGDCCSRASLRAGSSGSRPLERAVDRDFLRVFETAREPLPLLLIHDPNRRILIRLTEQLYKELNGKSSDRERIKRVRKMMRLQKMLDRIPSERKPWKSVR
ncbi:uncharacterized protein LOC112349978 [Selaginella moellendorffii]|uniref:uncharacterized protein LOC112349978 n=1 Tax=Selaginella moellendorffii TaxID=88036 RepID=UPI000D1C639A|nr:uncharacterized protein LOC112349978 [Selaginella moellendorffii]|eukprot:XP_024541099.1 uncharacterized protein LOC112349978 [Selaginella moellendorffii]